jgi:hypothetical protein
MKPAYMLQQAQDENTPHGELVAPSGRSGSEGCNAASRDIVPNYEIRYLNSDGELTLIHKTQHVDDEAVDLAALRMLMGSGLADYEILREDDARPELKR